MPETPSIKDIVYIIVLNCKPLASTHCVNTAIYKYNFKYFADSPLFCGLVWFT